VGPLAVATCGDESSAAEIREMPRNLWLIGLENLNTRADAEFIIAQQIDEPQSGVIRQSFEQGFEAAMHSNLITIGRELWFECFSEKSIDTESSAEYFTA
jgi:hypothetical protein